MPLESSTLLSSQKRNEKLGNTDYASYLFFKKKAKLSVAFITTFSKLMYFVYLSSNAQSTCNGNVNCACFVPLEYVTILVVRY